MTARDYVNPLPLVSVNRYAAILRDLLRSLDREIVLTALIGECEPDLLDAEREEVERVREFLDLRVVAPLESFELRGRGLRLLDAFEDEGATTNGHGSPSVYVATVAPVDDTESSVGGASGAASFGAPDADSGVTP